MITTIVMPVLNQIDYVLAAVESLMKYTHTKFNLHIVDNGSTKKVAKKLDEIYPEGQCSRLVVHSPGENLGYGGALNLVFRSVRSKYVVALNSDVWVTDYWLTNMLNLLELDEDIGTIGPATDYTSGDQMIKGSPRYVDNHKDYGKVSEWVQKFINGNFDSFTFETLIGFCQVFRRSAIVEVGYFDEQFFPGNYEDNDICKRLTLAGFKVIFTPTSFVFHKGHATFTGEGIDLEKSLKVSRKLFRKKWKGS